MTRPETLASFISAHYDAAKELNDETFYLAPGHQHRSLTRFMALSCIRSSLEFRVFHINGIALHVVLAGPANGKPLVFLHGFRAWTWHLRGYSCAFCCCGPTQASKRSCEVGGAKEAGIAQQLCCL